MNEKFCILFKISLKVIPKGQIDNDPAMVWIMSWRRTGNKLSSDPMLTWFTDARHLRWVKVITKHFLTTYPVSQAFIMSKDPMELYQCHHLTYLHMPEYPRICFKYVDGQLGSTKASFYKVEPMILLLLQQSASSLNYSDFKKLAVSFGICGESS